MDLRTLHTRIVPSQNSLDLEPKRIISAGLRNLPMGRRQALGIIETDPRRTAASRVREFLFLLTLYEVLVRPT